MLVLQGLLDDSIHLHRTNFEFNRLYGGTYKPVIIGVNTDQ